MARRLKRPISTLQVIGNDPFDIGETQEKQSSPVLGYNDEPYINNPACQGSLAVSSLYARHLNLIPTGDFVDKRNPDAVLWLKKLHADVDAETSNRLAISAFRLLAAYENFHPKLAGPLGCDQWQAAGFQPV